MDGVSVEEFVADEVMERVAAMASINIGELAKRPSDEFYEEYPDAELRHAVRTRDVYACGYFALHFEIVYLTAKRDYPRVEV